jgi:hypothetical protein
MMTVVCLQIGLANQPSIGSKLQNKGDNEEIERE